MATSKTLKARRLGEFLVEKGKITGEQLIRAIQSQRVVGGRIGTCLLEMDVMSEESLLEALSEQLLVPAAQIDDLRTVTETVLRLLPTKVAVRCQAIPLTATNKEIRVATLKVQNLEVLDELAFCTNKRVVPLIANEVRIYEALERYYGVECPSRYVHLLDRLNRSRYMWAEGAKVLLGNSGNKEVFWSDPDDVLTENRIIRSPSSHSTTLALTKEPTPVSPVRDSLEPESPPKDIELQEESTDTTDTQAVEASVLETELPSEEPPQLAVADPPLTEAPAITEAPDEGPPALRAEYDEGGIVPSSDSLTLEEVDQIFSTEPDRQTIGEIVIHFMAQSLTRCALFKIQHEKVQGWVAHGSDLLVERFLDLEISLAEPSVFHNLERGLPIHHGPLSLLPAHQAIASCWEGELARTCILLPIHVRKRLVSALFGEIDETELDFDLAPYHSLAEKTGMALELCILRRKLAER